MDERKRKRLEAWKKKREEAAAVKVSLTLAPVTGPLNANRKAKTRTVKNPFASVDDDDVDDDDDDDDVGDTTLIDDAFTTDFPSVLKFSRDDDRTSRQEEFPSNLATANQGKEKKERHTSKRSKRWDQKPNEQGNDVENNDKDEPVEDDELDRFMDKLQAEAMGAIPVKVSIKHSKPPDETSTTAATTMMMMIDVGGSVMRQTSSEQPMYHPNDWLSDVPMTPEGTTADEEVDQHGRMALIEALKNHPPPVTNLPLSEASAPKKAELRKEVVSEKARREQLVKDLEAAAARAVQANEASTDYGRMDETTEDGILEEAEQLLQQAATPDALTVLADLNKKKELTAVDHSKIEYHKFTKNLYRVPRAYAKLTNDEVVNRRAKLHVRVRGQGAPAPVEDFFDMGLSEPLLNQLTANKILKPYPIQAQCIPCIMAGRDVIGIAKTGSGKTLAYALPMLRHVSVQEHSDTPIALIMAPARELAFQIHSVCKSYAKLLGLNTFFGHKPLTNQSTAVYGGAGVAEQIADIKRGTQIITATPGRLIDLLTLQNGKLLSLQRVTFIVLDEADRMFDMGFSPQISAILAAVRPDRQTLLFSATFPKQIENLARQSLKYPVEVIVGGRSVASDSVTQYAELVEEPDKFHRLLQILGEQVEGTKKVIVFVDTQVRADSLFEQLLRNGYSSLSLHGGKEQEDRDSTLSDFKRKDGPNVLVATGVAARGLDVPACTCVVNLSAPNHLEAYVHQAGRTGRAGKTGVCYTLVSSDEAKFAPIITRALHEAGQAENVSDELKTLAADYKAKVDKGEAKYAGSGFKGKGFTYDATEISEAQRIARIEKRQALIEAGLLDPEDEDPLFATEGQQNTEKKPTERERKVEDIPDTLTPELLALPGMKEAFLRKAGITPTSASLASEEASTALSKPRQTPDNHWIQEFEINNYPREARWKVTQKETTSRMQDEFRTAVIMKGSYFPPGKEPGPGERKVYLHLESTSETILRNAVLEIQRMLNEETLRVSAKASNSLGSHKYNVV